VLTRLEVNGFKNLVDLTVDFGPFTCLAGPNGVGKSNLFDAIRFLSLLTDHTLIEAALRVRGSGGDSSDIADLFRTIGDDRTPAFRMAAEMIVEPDVRDDFGRPATATSTYLRYQIEIGYEAASARGSLGRLVLLSETLEHIREGAAATRLRFPHSAAHFRRKAVLNKRRVKSGFISVQQASDGQTEIMVHADGGSRGPGQLAPANSAPRTIVGTSNTSAYPTILAARREMQKWRFLALEPSAMRMPDRFHSESFVSSAGAHLPATVYRLGLEASNRGEDPQSVYASVAGRLAELVPVKRISVQVDDVRQTLTLEVEEQSAVRLPAGSLSDGTLRFLTLAIVLADPQAEGLICIEEPENGIHPAKMEEMVRLLKDLAVDPETEPGEDNPFRQVIVATHSPAFVQLQEKGDLLFAVDALVRGPNGEAIRTLRCKPLSGTWRDEDGLGAVGLSTILSYLASPPGAQLALPTLSVN
jgi:predicted ATPase